MKNIFVFSTLLFFYSSFLYSSDNTIPKAEWSIFVFLNGDNNLDSAGDDDINEMEIVGSTYDINVVVQQDKLGNTGTKRYLIQKDENPNLINSTIIENLPEVDMGNWNELVNFVSWGIQKYPANHYFVIIWNHGSGWRNYDKHIFRGVSYDDTNKNHITASDLTMAFGEIKKINNDNAIDMVGFDACLMGVAEIMEQLYSYTNYVIGSEQTEPFDGWPYEKFLAPLINKSKMNTVELGTIIVDEYGRSYSGGSQGKENVTLSLIDLNLWPSFREILNSFTLSLVANGEFHLGDMIDSAKKTQGYYFPYYKDIKDFALNIIEKMSGIQEIYMWATMLIDAIDNIVIANYASSEKVHNSHGIAINIPPDKRSYDLHKGQYKELYWSQLTKWSEFLESMYYPDFPVLNIKEATIQDDNDRIEPKDVLLLNLTITNRGGRSAEGVSLIIESNSEYVEIENTTLLFNIPKSEEVKFIALKSVISEKAPIGENIELCVKLIFKERIISKKYFNLIISNSLTYINTLITTPHPYPPYYNRSWSIIEPNAKTMALHFTEFDMEENKDFVHIYDGNGKKLATYTGKLNNFWTPDFVTNYVKIVVTSDYSGNGNGFYIDKYGIQSN